MDKLLRIIKMFIPKFLFSVLQPHYHRALSVAASAVYGNPSAKLKVIGVTGTNGKTTLVHLLTAILEGAGEPVASVSSLRFKIKGDEWKNMMKMTMPGRFTIQKFLTRAVSAGCKYAVLEVTSEGIKQFRHRGIDFYMAILTNITPEHTESHGTFENYRAAKAELFKKAKIHILNGEDPSIEFFAKIPAETRIVYLKKDLPQDFHLKMSGDFNIENAVAAYSAAKFIGIDRQIIKKVLESFENVPGRMEFILREPFSVVVDYAHTPDALEKVYGTLKSPAGKLICVLGSAGGGRDKWKRPEMGKIAAKFCDEIIFTNEDPYDENPQSILKDIENGFLQILNPKSEILNKLKTINYPDAQSNLNNEVGTPTLRRGKLILDRREAIREALKLAQPGDTIIITGKGAEPWLMGPNGTKIPWDDREVVREELKNLEK